MFEPMTMGELKQEIAASQQQYGRVLREESRLRTRLDELAVIAVDDHGLTHTETSRLFGSVGSPQWATSMVRRGRARRQQAHRGVEPSSVSLGRADD